MVRICMTKWLNMVAMLLTVILSQTIIGMETPTLLFTDWTIINLLNHPHIQTKEITFNSAQQRLILQPVGTFVYNNELITGKIIIRMNYDTTFALQIMLQHHKYPTYLESPNSSHLLEIRPENIKRWNRY